MAGCRSNPPFELSTSPGNGALCGHSHRNPSLNNMAVIATAFLHGPQGSDSTLHVTPLASRCKSGAGHRKEEKQVTRTAERVSLGGLTIVP